VERRGAPLGSVYHFFPGGKTQPVAEALKIHGEARALFQSILADKAVPLPERFRTLFRTAASGFDGRARTKVVRSVRCLWISTPDMKRSAYSAGTPWMAGSPRSRGNSPGPMRPFGGLSLKWSSLASKGLSF
jgi:hypothetical protein